MTKKIVNCLSHDLVMLYKKTAKLGAIESTIKKHLPPTLSCNVSVASFEKGILVISTSVHSARSELRFLLPALLSTLRKEASLYSLQSIKLINQI